VLTDEPGGYPGFSALYGNFFVAPQINHGENFVNDIDGNQINDSNGNVGFPGFDPSAAQTLGYLAQMLAGARPRKPSPITPTCGRRCCISPVSRTTTRTMAG
jgi:hypothetical protein